MLTVQLLQPDLTPAASGVFLVSVVTLRETQAILAPVVTAMVAPETMVATTMVDQSRRPQCSRHRDHTGHKDIMYRPTQALDESLKALESLISDTVRQSQY